MKKILLQAVILILLVTGLISGVALAAEGQLTPFKLIGPETTVNVRTPINVSWGAASFSVPISNNVTLWPGDKIAEVSVTIENASPKDYGVYFHASPGSVENNVWPTFEVKLIPQSLYGYASSVTLKPGEKKELLLEVNVAFYSQTATFHGLNIFLNYGEPTQPGEKG